jgi:hypothetical protein
LTFRRTTWIVLGAAVAGLAIGIVFSGDDLVSVEVWVGATAVAIVAVTMSGLLAASTLERATIKPVWTRIDDKESGFEPAGVRYLRSLVTSTQWNPRVHSQRLRSHLVRLAEHFLSRRHGLDIGKDTDQVSALLGETSWLIDPTVEDRAPTTTELERFLNILLAEGDLPGSTAQPGGASVP